MEKATQILTPHASPRQTGNAKVTASPAAGRILINDSAVLRHMGWRELLLPPPFSTFPCFLHCFLVWGMAALLCWKSSRSLGNVLCFLLKGLLKIWIWIYIYLYIYICIYMGQWIHGFAHFWIPLTHHPSLTFIFYFNEIEKEKGRDTKPHIYYSWSSIGIVYGSPIWDWGLYSGPDVY